MQINWEVTNFCNYNCCYCFNTNVNQKSINFLNEKYIEKVLDNILGLNKSTYAFTITGGEPTLDKNLFELIDLIYYKFNNKIESLNVITNASKDLDYFKSFLKYNTKNFFLRISFHPKYISPSHYKNLELMVQNNIPVKLSILFDNNQKENLKSIISVVDDYYQKYKKTKLLEPSLRKIFNCKSIYYTNNELNYLNKINQMWKVSRNLFTSTFNFRNKFCVGGKDLLILNSDLTFSSSYCNLFPINKIPFNFLNVKQIEKKMFNVVKCQKKACLIPTNWILPKFNNRNEAFQFFNIEKK